MARRCDDTDRLAFPIVSSLLQRGVLRVETLSDRNRRELVDLVDSDPIVNAVIAARLRQVATIGAAAFGGEVLGVRDAQGRLTAAALHAGNLMPIGGGPDEWLVLAGHLAGRSRICTSIVGRAAAVEQMWGVLAPAWGPARSIRASQPLLLLDREGAPHGGKRRVRVIRPRELDSYLPAAAAMFTEELGVSPYRFAGVREYRRRVAGLIGEGRAFGILGADGRVIFKADIGAVSPHTCQVHGVWVRPDQRRQGVGSAALADLFCHALTLAPTVSLYVNAFNTAARRTYARLGMREVATLATVLF
jgi:predicted GNAT family acetyltransferase